jgi:hypothetical protein
MHPWTKMQRCCCRTWSSLKTTDLIQLFELLSMMMQRCRHNFSAMSGSICCFILPYNGLAKLRISCNGGTGWQWNCARKTSALQSLHPQIAVRSWCSQVWICSSGIISAFRSVRSRVFHSRITRASSMLILERSELHRQLVGVAPRWSKT